MFAFALATAITALGAVPGLPVVADLAPASVESRMLEAQPGTALLLEVGERKHVAWVTRTGFSSDDVSVERGDRRLHGYIRALPLELELDRNRIAGRIGDEPVSLDVLPAPHELNVTGRFGARAVVLNVQPAGVTGEIGPCLYRLAFHGDGYSGQMTCGGQPEPVRLQVPVTFVARDPVELAAMLVAFLAA